MQLQRWVHNNGSRHTYFRGLHPLSPNIGISVVESRLIRFVARKKISETSIAFKASLHLHFPTLGTMVLKSPLKDDHVTLKDLIPVIQAHVSKEGYILVRVA